MHYTTGNNFWQNSSLIAKQSKDTNKLASMHEMYKTLYNISSRNIHLNYNRWDLSIYIQTRKNGI